MTANNVLIRCKKRANTASNAAIPLVEIQNAHPNQKSGLILWRACTDVVSLRYWETDIGAKGNVSDASNRAYIGFLYCDGSCSKDGFANCED